MSVPLSPSDRRRLSKLLGMVGSAHDGEALNAAKLADRLVRDRGATWDDALTPEGDGAKCSRRSSQSEPRSWRAVAANCGRYPLLLDKWETEFINGLHRFAVLSAKQQTKLTTIAARLQAAGCAL
jgi:hypothetical protein